MSRKWYSSNFKSFIKCGQNVVVNSREEINFPHELILTDTQFLRIKVFTNVLSANIEFSKSQLSKMIGV